MRLAVDELTGICRRGTVVVEEFMTVRERGSVQHLASRATGRLADGAGVMGQSTPEREWEETCEKLRSVAPHLRRSPDAPPAEPR